MFPVASVIMLDGAARLERFVSRSLRVTACRRLHFAPRVKQTPIKCKPTAWMGEDLRKLPLRGGDDGPVAIETDRAS